MADRTQRYFGVYQDVSSLKIAALQLIGKNELHITGLHRISLPEGEEAIDDAFLKDFEFNEGGEDTEYSELISDGKPEEAPSVMDEEILEHAPTRTDIIKAATEEYAMYSGRIALNLDEFNVHYQQVPMSGKGGKKRVMQDVRAALTTGSPAVYSWFPHDDDNVIGVSSQGSMDLLEHILGAGFMLPRRNLEVHSIQTNEMALINAVRHHYNLADHEITGIFYIGEEFSRVLVMQGNRFYSVLPIFNEGSTSEHIILKLHSRFLLDKQQHEIPELDRIFAAGDGIDDSMLDYLRETEPQAQVEPLMPLTYAIDTDVTPEEVTAFIIPIMLAAAVALPKDSSLIHANFTPRKLLERQNVLSMGVPSVLILAMTLGLLYLGMDSTISKAHENSMEKIKISELERRITANQAVIDSIRVLEGKIAGYEQKNHYVRTYIGDNNQWHYILKQLAECFQDRPLTWATNIRREGDIFNLEGSTSDRQHVIAISQLFPNTIVKQITEKEIESYTVWDYNLSCSMPDHLKTIMTEVQPQRTKIGQDMDNKPDAVIDDEKPAPVIITPEKPTPTNRDANAGQRPAITRVSSEDAEDGVYTVKQGDNLFRIALNYGTTVEELQRLNGLESETIYVGQKLKLPQSQ